MLRTQGLSTLSTNFKSDQSKDKNSDDVRVLHNNLKSSFNQTVQKSMSAVVDYPVKGLKGDVNSNFYEFLAMGMIPYLAGSAMFMIVFNALNLGKHLGAKDAKASSMLGKKMALGVVFYGLLKNLSKKFVTVPIRVVTGVDTELPYQNKVYNLPEGTGKDTDIKVQLQQRKVFDSKEFFRKDLLKRDFYDNVANKLDMGTNLEDSISETTPIIQNVVATSNTAKTLSSYAWAAVGVGLAMQKTWEDFFDAISNRKKYVASKEESLISKLGGKIKIFGSNMLNISKEFGKSFYRSCKQLWCGSKTNKGFMKHSGKVLIGLSTLMTVGLTANSIIKAKTMAKNNNLKTIDATKEITVI